MGENGATPDEIHSLLAGLPDTFDQWKLATGGLGRLDGREALPLSRKTSQASR
jgi:hypothetical protein